MINILILAEAAFDVVIVDTPKKVAHKKGEESPPSNIIEKYPHLEGTVGREEGYGSRTTVVL